MPSSSIKLHPAMSPWVFSRVKNKWAMPTRPSANRNQVGFDTVHSSRASSCCILEPGVTSWEQCQGQANHYLQLMTSWISHTLKFLLSFFLLNCLCLLLIPRDKDFQQFAVFGKRPESPEISHQSCTHQETSAGFPGTWSSTLLSPGLMSRAVTQHKVTEWVRDSSPYSTTVTDSFLEHISAPTCLSAVPQLLLCAQIQLSATRAVPGAFSSLQ